MIADMILKNGYIYTADKQRTVMQAIAVKDKKIIFVGNDEKCKSFIGSNTKQVDLNHKLVLPSFFEGHVHFTKSAEASLGVNLAGMSSEQEYIEALKQYLKNNPDIKIIRGQGYLESVFPGLGPNKKALDEVSTEIPIVLFAETFHSCWVNSKAIEVANVTNDTPDLPHGRIERMEDGSNEPRGCFREDAQNYITSSIPDWSVDEYKDAILKYQSLALKYGITGSFDPWVDAGSNSIKAIRELDQESKLNMHLRGAYWMNPARGVEQVDELVLARKQDNENAKLFKMNSVKFFMDGVLESVTAYLKLPYEHAEGYPVGYRGTPIFPPQLMNDLVTAVDKNGFQIHVHCAGDAAVCATLDGIEAAQKANGKSDRRHTITHIFLVDNNDLPRFIEMDVMAMLNSYWAQIDSTYFVNGTYIGKKRADDTFPINRFFEAGIMTSNASDYPITAIPNPFVGIEVGVTRIAPDNYHPWILDNYDDPKYHTPLGGGNECANLEDMVDSFTINQAYTNFLDHETGSLEVGKYADMIIVDRNIFLGKMEDIALAQIEKTYFRGKVVYSKD